MRADGPAAPAPPADPTTPPEPPVGHPSHAQTVNFGAAATRRDAPPADGPAALVPLDPAGAAAAARHPVGDAPVVVGRAPECDLVADDPSVSRFHARVTRAAGGEFLVADLGSRNGTHVNGARVAEALLRDGDELALGDARFRLEIDRVG